MTQQEMQVKVIKCPYCGKNLRPNYIREMIPDTRINSGWMREGKKILSISGYGYLNNNIFCTLRCGFYWAKNQFKPTK